MNKREKEKYALDLMQAYSNLKKELNKFGVCRTEREPTGDYAEWLVASRLRYVQAENTVQKGYDLFDPQTGKTYQIKARRMFKSHSYKVSIKKYKENYFDFVILVLFNEDFTVLKAYEFPYEGIKTVFKANGKDMELMISLSTYEKKLSAIDGIKEIKL